MDEWIYQFHACSLKVFQVSGYNFQIMDQRNRCNLFVNRTLVIW